MRIFILLFNLTPEEINQLVESFRRFYHKHLHASEQPSPIDLLDPDTAVARWTQTNIHLMKTS